MNDRELLELAAKAAGLRVIDRSAPTSLRVESDGCKSGVHWNPLSDDGDALRLAVKLGMQLDLRNPETRVFGAPEGRTDEHHRADPYAATRRAITRAAAEIGRSM